ncbi:MAG: ATP-binding cassette domain-containing protein [Holophagae bacterium]|jgi:ATPase subunit of ABC transporter with duplicated ATPase domains
MIAVTGLEKTYGVQTLFREVDFQLNPGNRYGLVGANGSGKSTLLRILSGGEEPSAGEISIPKRANLGVLEQDHFQYEDTPILQVTMMGHSRLWKAICEKERILEASPENFDADRYAKVEDLFVSLDGYSFEARAGEILEGLGIPTENHLNPLATLSGGFKLRVLLAQALAAEPEILLLDEPTNHLDIISIRWLEKFLSNSKGCSVVISHDHRFLDNVCTHILDIDYETVTLYTGNYTAFTSAKIEERQRKEGEIARQEKKIAQHQAYVDRFRAKATKARQAQSKLKMIDRIEVQHLPRSSRRYPIFRFKQARPSGKQTLSMEGVKKSFGELEVLHGVDLEVRRGDRLAIIGPNGIGKSTLLKIAVGELEPDTGEITWGYEARTAYFAQDHRQAFSGRDSTVEAWLAAACTGESVGSVRNRLGKVLFSGDEVEKRLTSLSGGEAARLIFARMAVDEPNVMILDEPTNHLDLEAIESLVKGLKAFDGTLIFVSHDRWFVSQLATRVFEITPESISDYRGTYDEYLASCGDDHLDADAAMLRVRREKRARKKRNGRQKAAAPSRDSIKRKNDLELRRDVVTTAIENAELRMETIDAAFCKPGFFAETDDTKIRAMQTERDRLAAELEEHMAEWERIEQELSEL